MSEPAIHTEGLTRRFGSVLAVRDLNLSVPQGVIYGLIGPNGAGKTTTLRLLLGLLQPSSGAARVLDCDPITQANRIRSQTGAVLEPCGLFEQLSALENLDFYGRIWHMKANDRAARAEELLQQTRLWDRRNETIAGWSLGLKQRLCLARSLMHRPSLLFLDEPSAGLDADMLDQTVTYLSDLVVQSGLTVLMATNNLDLSESTCHSVAILNRGRVLASDRTDRICCHGVAPTVDIEGRGFSEEVLALLIRRPEVTDAHRIPGGVALQLAARVDTAPLVSLLVESGAEIVEVRKSEPTLKHAVKALLLQDVQQEELP